MKEHRKFCAFTLLLLLWAGCAAEISLSAALEAGTSPDRFLEGENEVKIIEDAFRKLEGPKYTALKSMIVNDKLIKEGNKDCLGSNNNPKPMGICVNKETDKVTVEFIAPNENSTLTLDNLNLDAAEIELERYIVSFADLLLQQAITPEQKLEVINDALEESLKNNNVKVTVKKAEVSKGDKLMHVKVGEYTPEEGFDVVWDSATSSLSFKTNYFENVLTMTMTDKEVIAAEVKKAFEDVVRHVERTRRFSMETSNDEHSAEKVLTCATLLSVDDKTSLFNGLLGKVKPGSKAIKDVVTESDKLDNEAGSVIATMGKEKVTISCKKANEDSFALFVLTVNLGANFQPIEQPFFATSLYDLRPVAESFFEDVGTQMVQLFSAQDTKTN
jgi:hypothetical protein